MAFRVSMSRLDAMLLPGADPFPVIRDFFASRGPKRQAWLRALDTLDSYDLGRVAKVAADYGTAAGIELKDAALDLLHQRAHKPNEPPLGQPKRDPSTMQPSEINRELDAIGRRQSRLTDRFIEAGRGHERASETLQKDDPLAREYRELYERSEALRYEIARRYGPGAPHRLPRGFGPSARYLRPNASREPRLGAQRARAIVRRAAQETTDPGARDWLTRDERGTWEREAERLYQIAQRSDRFDESSEEEVERQIAGVLRYQALSTLIGKRRGHEPNVHREHPRELADSLRFFRTWDPTNAETLAAAETEALGRGWSAEWSETASGMPRLTLRDQGGTVIGSRAERRPATAGDQRAAEAQLAWEALNSEGWRP